MSINGRVYEDGLNKKQVGGIGSTYIGGRRIVHSIKVHKQKTIGRGKQLEGRELSTIGWRKHWDSRVGKKYMQSESMDENVW